MVAKVVPQKLLLCTSTNFVVHSSKQIRAAINIDPKFIPQLEIIHHAVVAFVAEAGITSSDSSAQRSRGTSTNFIVLSFCPFVPPSLFRQNSADLSHFVCHRIPLKIIYHRNY